MMTDENYRTHLFSYTHDGSRWTLEIKARDANDAKTRIGKLAYATYDGELVAKISTNAGWLARAGTWLRNTIGSSN